MKFKLATIDKKEVGITEYNLNAQNQLLEPESVKIANPQEFKK